MVMTVSVTRPIAAPAERVYALVTDLPRMGEWSPENTGGKWLDGATGPAVGARFKGTNRKGNMRWSATATITDATSPTSFAFDVTSGPLKVSRWSYTITPTATGCDVTESFTDRRPGLIAKVFDFGTRVSNRTDHNRRNIEITLERLTATAEAVG